MQQSIAQLSFSHSKRPSGTEHEDEAMLGTYKTTGKKEKKKSTLLYDVNMLG
jgi:hypothetical protein